MEKSQNQLSELFLDFARVAPDGAETVALMLETDFISLKEAHKALVFIRKLYVALKLKSLFDIETHRSHDTKKIIDDCKRAAKHLKEAIDNYERAAKELKRKSEKAPHHIS